jgi:hypothetical protein
MSTEIMRQMLESKHADELGPESLKLLLLAAMMEIDDLRAKVKSLSEQLGIQP